MIFSYLSTTSLNTSQTIYSSQMYCHFPFQIIYYTHSYYNFIKNSIIISLHEFLTIFPENS